MEFNVLHYGFVVNQTRAGDTSDHAVAGPNGQGGLGLGGSRFGKAGGHCCQHGGRFEHGFGAMVDTLVRIQETLETAGIVFISADQQGGPGVRLRDVPPRKGKRKR